MPEHESLRRFAHPRYWPTWAGAGLLRLLALLPRPLAAPLGSALGTLLYAVHRPRRRVVRTNLGRCFPELDARALERLVRRHFRAFGRSAIDVGRAWWSGPVRLRRLVRLRDRHHLDAALGSGRNVILLAPHFLGLEIGGVRLSLESPLVSVFHHPKNRLLRELMWRGRTRFGLNLTEYKRSFVPLVRAVKSGMPLYYLPDQDAGRRHAVFAPFFGIPAATFTALSRLARMTDAVVIPCVTYERPWPGGYEMVFFPPLAGFPGADEARDAERMNAEIERAVRLHPEQYFWLHKRFKTRPAGEPPFYPAD
ncbi:MAG TPA: lysophospholipid acyltransferase family protein [Burkholderiales bacterium]